MILHKTTNHFSPKDIEKRKGKGPGKCVATGVKVASFFLSFYPRNFFNYSKIMGHVYHSFIYPNRKIVLPWINKNPVKIIAVT